MGVVLDFLKLIIRKLFSMKCERNLFTLMLIFITISLFHSLKFKHCKHINYKYSSRNLQALLLVHGYTLKVILLFVNGLLVFFLEECYIYQSDLLTSKLNMYIIQLI